ncbi:MAG: hypothetical protein A2V79_08855 [Betaproteobacteria bacterium RBG_16_56_24]|nr:MAG: hypothetical protein A2V79_08855 [Betaproteobacteria bacterium RBG_16_56_24]
MKIAKLFLVILFNIAVAACGGGGGGSSGGSASSTFHATSGVAQKGPLLLGSTVTAQELDATLIPTGKQYTYQINSDLGTFSPTSTFTSAYIDLNATGYYFDEVLNAVSSGTVVLNGLNVLSSDTVLNVNLLTTLVYQRTKALIASGGMTFLAARQQAEKEVLAVFHIRDGNQYGSFGSLDLSRRQDGDNILAAISSMFVFGNTAGNMSALIANFQTDIAANGTITSAATNTALTNAAKGINPVTVASNLTSKYSSLGISFLPIDISNWLDQDGDGVIGKFKFQVAQAPAATPYSFPAYTVGASDNGAVYSIANGQFTINGGAATTSATVTAGNSIVVTRTPVAHDSSSTYLQSGTLKVARYDFNPFATAGSLTTDRTELTTTVLQNGKVLVTGGIAGATFPATPSPTSSAELYDSAANQWTVVSSMAVTRDGHTATLLNNGKVLVVGGGTSAELYDPTTDTWAAAASPATTRSFHTATLLPNGKVLVAAGGYCICGGTLVASAELYDPVANTWTSLPDMNTAGLRYYHTATLLQNGMVLIAGGLDGNAAIASAELFDPALNSWTTVGSLAAGSYIHSATLLGNGKVLLAGGAGTVMSPTRAELFDPTTNTWTAAASLATGRYAHIAQLLNDGKVLVAGGASNGTDLASAELYDPVTNTWVAQGNLAYARSRFGAAMLNSGKVLMVGGQGVNVAETFQ